MSKITKKELQYQINGLAAEASTRHNSIMRIHRALASIGVDIFSDDFDLTEPEPQLKQLDQRVFDGQDPKFITAATDRNGYAHLYPVPKNELENSLGYWYSDYRGHSPRLNGDYDASNWQNSLIERDIAKELLEVDLSSELTGSDLCRAMINRGDKIVLCIVKDYEHEFDTYYDAITHCSRNYFESSLSTWQYAIPINNQGEPLTAAEAGF